MRVGTDTMRNFPLGWLHQHDESIVRLLSKKAQMYYNETEPIQIYGYVDEFDNYKQKYAFRDSDGWNIDNTKEQLDAEFCAMYDAVHEFDEPKHGDINVLDYDEVIELLKRTGFSVHDMPLFGQNEDGESVILSTIKDISDGSTAFRLETIQANGWVRNNVFYKDGTTEEFYER